MKRRMTLALVLAMSLSAAFAMAEETNSLKDFTSRLKGGTVQAQSEEPGSSVQRGTIVTITCG